MFDHVALSVPQDKYRAVVDFYLAALAPLNYEKLISMFEDKLVALGDKNSPMENKANFWLSGMAETVVEKNYAHWAFAADGEWRNTRAIFFFQVVSYTDIIWDRQEQSRRVLRQGSGRWRQRQRSAGASSSLWPSLLRCVCD